MLKQSGQTTKQSPDGLPSSGYFNKKYPTITPNVKAQRSRGISAILQYAFSPAISLAISRTCSLLESVSSSIVLLYTRGSLERFFFFWNIRLYPLEINKKRFKAATASPSCGNILIAELKRYSNIFYTQMLIKAFQCGKNVNKGIL